MDSKYRNFYDWKDGEVTIFGTICLDKLRISKKEKRQKRKQQTYKPKKKKER